MENSGYEIMERIKSETGDLTMKCEVDDYEPIKTKTGELSIKFEVEDYEPITTETGDLTIKCEVDDYEPPKQNSTQNNPAEIALVSPKKEEDIISTAPLVRDRLQFEDDYKPESTNASTTEVQTFIRRRKTNAQRCKEYRERKKLQNAMGQNITAKRADECSETGQLQAKRPKTNAERRKKHYEAQKLKNPKPKKIPKTAKQRRKEYNERKKLKQALNTLNHSDALQPKAPNKNTDHQNLDFTNLKRIENDMSTEEPCQNKSICTAESAEYSEIYDLGTATGDLVLKCEVDDYELSTIPPFQIKLEPADVAGPFAGTTNCEQIQSQTMDFKVEPNEMDFDERITAKRREIAENSSTIPPFQIKLEPADIADSFAETTNCEQIEIEIMDFKVEPNEMDFDERITAKRREIAKNSTPIIQNIKSESAEIVEPFEKTTNYVEIQIKDEPIDFD